MQVSQSPLLSPPPAKMKRLESVKWPAFHNKGIEYPTEVVDGRWKCPMCSHCTPRIRQHLATHKSIIGDWTGAEIYCEEVALLRRREADRERDKKRAGDPKRKEVLKKADKKREPKRAEEPRGKRC